MFGVRWFSRKYSISMTSNLLKRSARGCACKHGFSGAAMALLKFLQHRGAGFGLAGILLHARCPLAVERLAVTQSQPISPSSCLLGLSLCLFLSSFAIDALDLSSRSRHATAHFPKFPASTLYSRSQVKSSQVKSSHRPRSALYFSPTCSPRARICQHSLRVASLCFMDSLRHLHRLPSTTAGFRLPEHIR